jgi:hypothetical protein
MALIGVNGGLIGNQRSANVGAASGIWTANEQVVLKRTGSWAVVSDAAAAAYIAAVEAADGQPLEDAVKTAINSFVVGCKADGIWTAIKASCILAGARTLAGALVPLVGAAPTNFNFVSGDYNRETGLVGNGSTKYLDTNSSPTASPETLTNFAYAVYCSELPTNGVDSAFIGYRGDSAPIIFQLHRTNSNQIAVFNKTGVALTRSQATGFIGSSRSGTSEILRSGSANTTATTSATGSYSSQTNVGVYSFREVNGNRLNVSNARISFYLQAGFLDLALLDTRVTTLINAIAAAIP